MPRPRPSSRHRGPRGVPRPTGTAPRATPRVRPGEQPELDQRCAACRCGAHRSCFRGGCGCLDETHDDRHGQTPRGGDDERETT